VLIVADALGQMLGGNDEDKAQHINAVYANVWRVVNYNGAAFMMLHHSGWDEKRERGSSAIRANSDIVIQIVRFEPEAGRIILRHLKRRDGVPLQQFGYQLKLVPVPGCRQPVPICTGEKLDPAQTLLSQSMESFTQNKRHAQKLVALMAKEFQPQGATFRQLERKAGMGNSTYKRAFNTATAMKWFVGGGARGLPYNLNPNGNWKVGIGSKGPPHRGVDPTWTLSSGPPQVQGGPDLDLTQSESCNDPEINEGDSDKFDRLLALTSQAIRHVDDGKKKGPKSPGAR
jgi:hypothetical protein